MSLPVSAHLIHWSGLPAVVYGLPAPDRKCEVHPFWNLNLPAPVPDVHIPPWSGHRNSGYPSADSAQLCSFLPVPWVLWLQQHTPSGTYSHPVLQDPDSAVSFLSHRPHQNTDIHPPGLRLSLPCHAPALSHIQYDSPYRSLPHHPSFLSWAVPPYNTWSCYHRRWYEETDNYSGCCCRYNLCNMVSPTRSKAGMYSP